VTEEWLRDAGFKYTTPDKRYPDRKHWVLWFGSCIDCGSDELAIELAIIDFKRDWFCWLRSDTAHRYHRFIHLRHLKYIRELEDLVAGLTGQAWDVANNVYGVMQSPEVAARYRSESERLDRKFIAGNCPWDTTERDEDLAKPSHEDRRIAIGGKRIMGGQECDD